MALYVVDGTFELFRCHHGAPKVRVGGREVGAVRGLLQSLVALLRTADLTHVAVAFDSLAGTVRLPADAGPNEIIRSQYDLAADAVRGLGLTIWPMWRYQADDALATAARLHRDHTDRVVLCTNDKDLAQCVRGEHVVLLDRIKKVVLDEAGVHEKFGVAPASIPDLLGLVGDDADGLPGLPGWGARTAATVLRRWGHVEHIPDDPDAWDVPVRGAARLATVLRERRREALLYRNLAILRDDVPLPDTFEDLRWLGADRGALDALTARIEDTAALDRVPRWR